MMAKKYWADATSVGDGWEDASAAARIWNRVIRPALLAAMDDDGDNEEAIDYAAQWAWEEFCSREAGDDESLAMDLGLELEAKLNAQ